MDILLEKFYQILKDIESFCYPESEPIVFYKIKKDKESGLEVVDLDTSDWEDYETGTPWGQSGQHCWFRTNFCLPSRFHDQKVIYTITTGHKEGWDISNPQFLAYVNGKLAQGLDVNHKTILLNERGVSGECYHIALLGYSGLSNEQVSLKSFIKIVDSQIEDFYYNFSNLFWTLCLLDEKDHERVELTRHLDTAVSFLDFRKIYSEEFYKGLTTANQWLIEHFYTNIRENGPIVTTLGHTHIDVAWMWTTQQTREKVVRSFATVLYLMSLYPEYTFMSSQPQLYEYVKEEAPELYEQIKEKIKEGRWEVDGGMWLEADCNIPSGESLSRQLLYGISFIKEEFGKTCTTLWLPDVFGYSAALPQLILKSGLSYFMTTKLDWNQFNKMPHDTFIWRGIDGSEVLTHLITTTDHVIFDKDIYGRKNPNQQTTYNGRLNVNQVLGTWSRYKDSLLSDEVLMVYGFGDGGGGPTQEMLENFKRLKYGLPGMPKVQMDQQKHFFERLQKKSKDSKYLKKWQGELYFENHRGTYTSMARNKRYNRKAEFLFQDIECLCTIAKNYNFNYPKAFIKQNWKRILLNQFHDILPGTSIKQVYEETDVIYQGLLNEGEKVASDAMVAITQGIGLSKASIVVFNTLSYSRTDLIEMNNVFDYQPIALKDNEGNILPVTTTSADGKILFLATNVPSKGYKVYECLYEKADYKHIKCKELSKIQIEKNTSLEQTCVSSPFYKLIFNSSWELVSIYDIINEREILKENGRGNVLQIFEDRPRAYENWNIDCYYQDKAYEIQHFDSARVIENNELRTCIEIVRKYQASTIKQKIFLYSHNSRIDFKTEVDWHEQKVLLKAAFDVDINSNEATYEIQYGHICRTTHENTSWDMAQFEVCGHKWADLSETGYGVSLLNDCKYGYDIKDGLMRLTLIKCGTYPNPDADQGFHEFTYSIYAHKDKWQEAKTQELAMELNIPLRYYAKSHSDPIVKDTLIPSYSLANISIDNVIVDTIKEHETSENTIVRLYEFKNKRSTLYFKTDKKIKSVHLCNLVENIIAPIKHDERGFVIAIKPLEVLTYLIEFDYL